MLENFYSNVSSALANFAWEQWFSSIFLLVLGFFLASTVSRSVERFMARRASRHHAVMIRRLVFYLIILLFAIAALREAGFSLDVVLGAAGILSVAIGFASQTSASNMISGLFLLVEKPFEIGDVIEIESTVGEVVGIDMLSVKLRTPDNLYVRIPNETLIKTQVVNRSRFPIRRLDLTFGIAYAEDVEKVEALLLSLTEKIPVCLEEPKPYVLVTAFEPTSVQLQFSVWVLKDQLLSSRSSIMVAIKKALDREGIAIPFSRTSIYASSQSEPFRVQLLEPETTTEKESRNVDKSS